MIRRYNKYIPHLFSLVLMMLALLIMGGCSSDEPSEMKEDSCKILILLETPSAESSGTSKSEDSVTRSERSGNTIVEEERVKNLALFILMPENASFPIVSRYLGRENGKYQYEATLSVSSDYVTYDNTNGTYRLSGRMVAVANMPENPHPHPLDQPSFPLGQLAESGVIPMWGVTMISDLEIRPGDRLDVGTTIELLRSLPKFTFQLADDIRDEYVISSVSSSTDDFNLMAFCQPGACRDAFKTEGMTKNEWFNPAEEGIRGSEFPIFGLGTSEVSLYTAERSLEPLSAATRYFDVILSRIGYPGEEIKGRVYLGDYRSGVIDPNRYFTRLVRNHDYRYEISLAGMEMLISFREWVYGGKVHIELE